MPVALRNLGWERAFVGLLLFLSFAADTCSAEPSPSTSRLGINLAGPADWNTEHPFVDVFRLSRRWISQRAGATWGQGPELERDAHGWITRLETNCWAESPILTHGHAPRGDYVCLYQGEGELRFTPNAGVIARSPGRIVVTLDGAKGGVFVQLRATNPRNPLRQLRLLMPGFESPTTAPVFAPAFLARWRGFNTLRFMDWMETNGSEQREWSDRPQLLDAHWTAKGVPVEVMVDLCNQLGANPWFCMPHLASDDYVRQFARLVKARLQPQLKVYVEYSNELWNGGFAQTKFAEREGRRLSFSEKPWEAGWRFAAYRSVQIHRLWAEEFGGRERLVRVMATQAAVPAVSEEKLRFQEAWRHCDALAVAPYFSLNVAPEPRDGRPGAAEISGWSVERTLAFVATNSLGEAADWMRRQKAIADRYQLRLIAYEAGQHLVGVNGAENNEGLTRLLQSVNRHPRMRNFYTHYLDDWQAAGGDLICLFSSVGSYSKWGSWGLLEFADEPRSPKFDAVQEWNRAHPRPDR
jgi:hypothetical protein